MSRPDIERTCAGLEQLVVAMLAPLRATTSQLLGDSGVAELMHAAGSVQSASALPIDVTQGFETHGIKLQANRDLIERVDELCATFRDMASSPLQGCLEIAVPGQEWTVQVQYGSLAKTVDGCFILCAVAQCHRASSDFAAKQVERSQDFGGSQSLQGCF